MNAFCIDKRNDRIKTTRKYINHILKLPNKENVSGALIKNSDK